MGRRAEPALQTDATAADNAALVRRWNERIWQGDQRVFDELLDPHCLFHWLGGVSEVRATIARIRTSFDELDLTVEDQFAVADKVVTRWTLSGVHSGELWGVPATGKRVVYTGITINRLAHRRIVEEWCESDLIGLMQQIGAYPASSPTGTATMSSCRPAPRPPRP